MKWLLTGGCGFIGVNLVAQLLERGDQVRILDNLSVGSREDLASVAKIAAPNVSEIAADEVELLVGDIRDPAAVDTAVRGVDAVVHLAAQTGVIPSMEDPADGCLLNVNGTLNLLIAARDHAVGGFVLASSGAALGDQDLPLHEEKVAKPLSPYGASKLAGEAYSQAFFATYGLPTICLRFANVYGPHSFKKGSVVAEFFRRALAGKPLIVYGDGNQTRDFVHAEDICQAIIQAATSGVGGEVFQIATEKETPINDLAERVKSLVESNLHRSVDIVYKPSRKGEVLRNTSDITKARTLLDFHPRVEFDHGLRQTLEWFEEMEKAAGRVSE